MMGLVLGIGLVVIALSAHAQLQLPGAPASPSFNEPAPVLPGAQPVPPHLPGRPATAPPAPAEPQRGLRGIIAPEQRPPQQAADPTGVRDLAQVLSTDNNFNLPGIPAAILRGDFNALPDDLDTRALVSSYLRIINEACGEQAVDLALAMFRYASNEFRGGFNVMFRAEGFADARYLISRIGCVGNPFNTFIGNYTRLIQSRAPRAASPQDPVKFAALMSPAFRARNNIPDPDRLQRDRLTADATGEAEAACVARYAQQAFCRCVVDSVRGLSDNQTLRALSPSFDRIVSLPIDLAFLEERILACERLGGRPRP
ncbi:MAG: hypothetical protein JNK84_23080 [Phreatobacter sp.]|uniref:hypothetical protein n=1 Tax=Phreatobacter sp. TaxID=1966341 RepID=UPI001A518708|nr:hypothetical protein [Phreatobacter sp.]MBL8571969.1 hypothetical protein [Phreatobacter sp.]